MIRKVAMAFGTFDILHPGHLHYLKAASRYGRLVVVVARDETVRKLKKRTPIFSERSRLQLIRSLGFVDDAFLGGKLKKPEDRYRVILCVRPDYIVLGYDQKADLKYLNKFLKDNMIKARIVRARPFNQNIHKSSKIAERIMSFY
jgi:FAD synthetase